MRAHQRPSLREGVEIASNRDCRHVEALDQILDGDPVLFVEEIEYPAAPLFHEELQRFPVRDFDHDWAHPEFDRDGMPRRWTVVGR